MPATPFSADVLGGPAEATIVLHGDVNAEADPAFGEAYDAATSAGGRSIVLDFGDVAFMSSTGIALVVELLSRALREGRTLRAIGLSPHYREIFEITRLAEHIALVDDGTATATGGTA